MIKDKSETKLISNIFTLNDLIRMPIEAVLEANVKASESAMWFIREYGFEPGSELTQFGKIRMVSFQYEYTSTNGKKNWMKVQIPVISLVPLPFLVIKDAEFDFAVQILDNVITEKSFIPINPEPGEQIKNEKILALMAPMSTSKEKVENTKSQSSLEANMRINVKVVQSDLPAGILQLLNLGQEATEGNDEFAYVIKTSKNKLHFTDKNKDQKLNVQLEINTNYPNHNTLKPEDQIITITVISYTEPVDFIFDKNITLIKGNILGESSKKHIQAITDKNGNIEFEMFSSKDATGNGLVKIENSNSETIQIYFNVERSK